MFNLKKLNDIQVRKHVIKSSVCRNSMILATPQNLGLPCCEKVFIQINSEKWHDFWSYH